MTLRDVTLMRDQSRERPFTLSSTFAMCACRLRLFAMAGKRQTAYAMRCDACCRGSAAHMAWRDRLYANACGRAAPCRSPLCRRRLLHGLHLFFLPSRVRAAVPARPHASAAACQFGITFFASGLGMVQAVTPLSTGAALLLTRALEL
jgi:hypothetical protein